MSSLSNIFDALNDSGDSDLSSSDDEVDKSLTPVKSQESRKRLYSDDDESLPEQPKPKKEALQQINELTCSRKENTTRPENPDVLVSTNKSIIKHFEISNVDTIEIKIHTVETLEKCLHEVALPSHTNYTPLKKPNKLLKDYKFTLDPFQNEAIMCIENNESVLVSAHTSSGKTVVGEYSILKSLKLKQRVIYTTPIKALSNQKYREFQEEFQDVGLLTGDVSINPNAGCLIMTTEILRNMLYRGSEVTREVAWVIFDEIHYLRDLERGVVWEEALILLPDNVRYVFLSATIPNARQFAQWIVHIHKQPCHVIYTDFRPTPLQHFILPIGGESVYKIVDDKGNFNERNFELACKSASDQVQESRREIKQKHKDREFMETSCFKLVRQIMGQDLSPALIFSFSKKDCEMYAMQMCRLNLNSSEEKKLVDEVFLNAMTVLSDEDRSLPQVVNVLPLLRRGIGIHHGGLLPILKETIELLFSEGLIKALFATETFAMGLNMPAKCVIFTGLKKFDGKNVRRITSGEYIQMSGRAGRRGLDDKGTVIVMLDEPLSIDEGKGLMQGKADPLKSAFRLTYNMLLNLIRVEHIYPEYLLERSFLQFQNRANISNLQQKYNELEVEISKMIVEHESTIESYYMLKKESTELNKKYHAFICDPEYLMPFLTNGRLALVAVKGKEIGWGMILSFKRVSENKKSPLNGKRKILIDFYLRVDINSPENNPEPCLDGGAGKRVYMTLPHDSVKFLSSVVLHIPKNLRDTYDRSGAQLTYRQALDKFRGKFPILDPVKHMKISDDCFTHLVAKIEKNKKEIKSHPACELSNLGQHLLAFKKKSELKDSLESIKDDINRSMSLLQMEELTCRKRVLRRLKFCTETDVIELKGQVGCGISCADELLLTEMIFNGLFNELSPQQSAALLSCFVCEGRSDTPTKLSEDLAKPLREAKEVARWIVRVSQESKMSISEDTYIDQMKPYLMDIVYLWCNGSSFHEICKKTDIFEGSIIRCIRSLEELLRQLKQAAMTMGNNDLENKFSTAIDLIKRDIVFAASLYL